MEEGYQFVALEKPDWDLIGDGINEYNLQNAGPENGKNLCFVVKNPDGVPLGGVIGITFWDWLFINLMWLKEEHRGRGFGQRLLALAEDEARQRGVKYAYLDTFSFQAPEFYKKNGYRVFGELEHFPAWHTRYFLTKEL